MDVVPPFVALAAFALGWVAFIAWRFTQAYEKRTEAMVDFGRELRAVWQELLHQRKS